MRFPPLRFVLNYALVLALVLPQPHLLFASSQPIAPVTAESSDRSAIEAEGAFLEQAILGEVDYHPLDTFRILAQEAIDLPKPHLVDISAVSVQVVDEEGRLIKELSRQSRETFVNRGRTKYRIQLAYRGKVFLKFRAPIESVAVQGPYVIFSEQQFQEANSDLVQLSFIDLQTYKPAIGKTAIPVFRMPVETQSQNTEMMKLRDGSLRVNGTRLTTQAFDVFGQSQEMLFNMSVAAADAKTLELAEPILADVQNYIVRALDLTGQRMTSQDLGAGQEQLKQVLARVETQMRTQADLRSSKVLPGVIADQLKFQFSAERQNSIDELSKQISDERAAQRKLMGRVKALRASLMTPQPLGAPKLARAMAFVASGIRHKSKFELNQALRHFASSRSSRMGIAIGSGLALGTLYPAEASAFMYGSLDVTRTAAEVVFGRLRDLGQLGVESVRATFTGFNPVYFKEAYLTPESLPKVGIGLTALFTSIYLAIGVPHILANSFFLVKDLKKIQWRDKLQKEGSVWKAFRSAFIRRQQKLQRDYLTALSSDANDGQVLEYTSEEDLEVENIIRDLEVKEKRGWFSSWLKKRAERKPPNGMEINTFAGALRHFFFSYATFTISGRAYTAIWNTWFGIRSFVWSPRVVAAVLLYPNIWKRATDGQLPSRLNGGLRLRGSNGIRHWFNRSELQQLSAIEDKILEVEKTLSKYALRASFQALADYVKDLDDLKKVYSATHISKISSKEIDKLTSKQRTFFRSYYESLMEKSTRAYLEEKGFADAVEGRASAVEAGSLQQLSISDAKAKQLVRSAADRQLVEQATRAANSTLQHKAIITNLKADLVSYLDADRNPQVNRIRSVNRQAAKPQAMARAVRSMIASNIVDKPLELLFTFACLAGITSGVLQPIQDDLHGENSWFHLSRMVFSNGFLYGVISGVFADVWMKLQQDELHEGQFGKVPEGDDAQKSFGRYYFKRTFKNSDNSLWKNQMHNMKIVWANMKAAFTTMVLVGLATMGRLDLDAYIVGYLFIFLTPLSGFAFKLEQGFELASSYFAKDIPEKYRSHPRSQQYLNKVVSKKRMHFNFFYKTYENVMGYLVFSFQQMTSATFGSRAFSRVLLGGYTWTELAVGGLNKTAEKVSWIPGMSKVTDACTYLLSNNYTDFEKIKPTK